MRGASRVTVRNTKPEDFPAITEICREVYPGTLPWGEMQLASHLRVFPEGQFVAEIDGRVAGMAASLIVVWDDYDVHDDWRDMTDYGMFTNHDPEGHTLYGAEIMVRPSAQGQGVGKAIYRARQELVERLGLLRIRAGARLRDYGKHAGEMSAREYVRKVVRGELADRTLTFQLRRGFHVVAVVEGYLRNDPDSLGYAAVIEWINEKVAKEEERDCASQAYGRYE
jgi:ribosomal protein S18 acetylase RimI-like enzyme